MTFENLGIIFLWMKSVYNQGPPVYNCDAVKPIVSDNNMSNNQS